MLSVTGVPYDTIHSVIGIDKSSKGHGSLADFGVKFEYIELTENDEIDYDAIEKESAAETLRWFISSARAGIRSAIRFR